MGGSMSSAPRVEIRLRAAGVMVLLALLPALAGCMAEPVFEATAASCEGEECVLGPRCDGESVARFCDDCNPCTIDVVCTPCSQVDEGERDMRSCTPDAEILPACAGTVGCLHLPIDTAEGVRNACFPVAGDPELHPGVCLSGRCVENE